MSKRGTLSSLVLCFVLYGLTGICFAELTLTVNDLDTTMPVQIEPDDDIIIAVTGETDEHNESYSVTCEMGGKLTAIPEPNTPAEEPNEGDYLFTFEDEELGVAAVNLNVGDILDYQLILFRLPDANTVIFGIDSDAIEIPEPKSEQLTEPDEPNEPESMQEEQNTHIMQIATQSLMSLPFL